MAARQFEPLDSRLGRETYLDAVAAATVADRLVLGGGMREVAEAARVAPPSEYRAAVLLALAAMAFELLTLAWIRRRFFGTSFLRSFISVTLGGAIIATIGAALGAGS
jgi:hypothetical protein